MNLVLIDDIGTIWDGRSKALRQAFDAPLADDEFSSYMVKNLGFIAITLYGNSCEIRTRPRLVSPKSLESLCTWLDKRQFARVVTVHFDTDWRYRMHTNGVAALSALHQLLSVEQQLRPGDYLMQPSSIDKLPNVTPQQQALHSLLTNWQQLAQSVHRDGLKNIMKQALQGRYHIVDAATDSDTLTFREIGHGFLSYSDEWVAQACGTAIEEQEDRAYGQWIASVYRDVLRVGEPRICDVDTIMVTKRLGRARVRYKRVVLPARSTGGGMWLLNSSIIDHSIDLRANLLKKCA